MPREFQILRHGKAWGLRLDSPLVHVVTPAEMAELGLDTLRHFHSDALEPLVRRLLERLERDPRHQPIGSHALMLWIFALIANGRNAAFRMFGERRRVDPERELAVFLERDADIEQYPWLRERVKRALWCVKNDAPTEVCPASLYLVAQGALLDSFLSEYLPRRDKAGIN